MSPAAFFFPRLATVAFALGLLACGALSSEELSRDAVVERITTGIRLLNQQYWSPALNIWLDRPGDDLRAHYGGRRNPPWWPSAIAVEGLLDFIKVTGRSDYEATIATLYELQKDRPARAARVVAELKRRRQWSEADERDWQRRQTAVAAVQPASETAYYTDFQNEYLDDSGWWAITWLRMHDRTRDPKYLATAKTIHAHMAKNWRPEKGGGVIWCEDPDKQRPNATAASAPAPRPCSSTAPAKTASSLPNGTKAQGTAARISTRTPPRWSRSSRCCRTRIRDARWL